MIFKRAVRHKLIATSPLEGLEGAAPRNRKEIRVLTPDEVDRLLQHAPAEYHDLLACLAFSGIRISECLGLTWGDVDTDTHRLNIEYQLSVPKIGQPAERVRLKTKGSRRKVPMLGTLSVILAQRYEAAKHSGIFPASTAYVFSTASGKPLCRTNATQRGMAQAARDAGIKGVSCHSLRHTFASTALQSGVDVSTVSRWLGHSGVMTTLGTYSHWISADLDDLAAARASAAFLPVARGGV